MLVFISLLPLYFRNLFPAIVMLLPRMRPFHHKCAVVWTNCLDDTPSAGWIWKMWRLKSWFIRDINIFQIHINSSFMNVLEKSTSELNWIKIDDARIKNDCINRFEKLTEHYCILFSGYFRTFWRPSPAHSKYPTLGAKYISILTNRFWSIFCEDNCFKNDYVLVANFAYDYHRVR